MGTNLASYIMKEAEFLGFTDMYTEETKSVIKYFLEKNIKSMLGKTEFTINQDSNSEILINEVVGDESKSNSLIIDFGGIQYTVSYQKGDSESKLELFEGASRDNGYSFIEFNKEKGEYVNAVTYFKEGTYVKETQKVNVSERKLFEYQKEVSIDGNVTKYPSYMMRPAGVKSSPDNEMYEIISPEETATKKGSFLKKLLAEVKNPSLIPIKTEFGDSDSLAYIDKVFEVMEEKTNSLEESKKL